MSDRDPEPVFRPYSRGELIADATVHVAGVLAAAIAVPILVVLAAVWHGSGGVMGAAAVYGTSMMAMLAFSALYNMIERPSLKPLLRRLDHGAIYVKIAGTYTPFAVLAGGSAGVPILAAIWSAAAAGLLIVWTTPRGHKWMSLILYLAMGWAVAVMGGPMLAAMSDTAIGLIVAGGLLYTVGVVFHLWNRLRYQNAIWHAHVLVATVLFYIAVVLEVGRHAP
ncbi:MAG: hemolysin III family protein [Pseudomonadota bacterium]